MHGHSDSYLFMDSEQKPTNLSVSSIVTPVNNELLFG